MRTPDELWRAWLRAVADVDLPLEAKAHAETLLDVMRTHGDEPQWRAVARRRFLHWCEQEGLLGRGRS